MHGACGEGSVQAPKPPALWSRGVRGGCWVLALLFPLSAGTSGGWSCLSWKPQGGFSRDRGAGQRGRDILDPSQSIPVSRRRVDTTSQVCDSQDRPVPLCPWTHPAILATGSEAGAEPSQEVGAAGGAARAEGEVGMRFPSRTGWDHRETPEDPRTATQHSTTTEQP